jgi:hypothetical protein
MNVRPFAVVVMVLLPFAARAAEDSDVAVVPFQGLGAEPALVDRVADSLRAQVAKRHFLVMGADQTKSRQRAAAMCGEDVECLATLGQRLQARYIVAFGLGRVGDGAMFTSLVIDVAQSKKVAEYTERLSGFPDDPSDIALRAASTLFVDITPGPKLVPKEPSNTVLVASEPVYKLRPLAWGFTIGAGVAVIAGVVLTILAQQSFSALPNVKPADRLTADNNQRTLNLSADITMSVGVAAGITALGLFLFDSPQQVAR